MAMLHIGHQNAVVRIPVFDPEFWGSGYDIEACVLKIRERSATGIENCNRN
ncbi:hypothetical protein ACDX78_06905 [Virgibacillus oceani]